MGRMKALRWTIPVDVLHDSSYLAETKMKKEWYPPILFLLKYMTNPVLFSKVQDQACHYLTQSAINIMTKS